ncbi:MAG: DUF805 domain-containing protein [Actinomycetota bacterium]|nr:DUF805 domain-containing protein [Actinomycetota bacterium]
MTFFESIKTVFRKYADFGGRASRPEFWWFALFSALVSAALNALSVPISGAMYGPSGVMSGRMFEAGATGGSVYGYLSFASVWSIAVLLPTLAVTVRRLRDAGRNWSELFWLLLPIAGVIVLIVHLCDASRPADGAVASPTGGAVAAS